MPQTDSGPSESDSGDESDEIAQAPGEGDDPGQVPGEEPGEVPQEEPAQFPAGEPGEIPEEEPVQLPSEEQAGETGPTSGGLTELIVKYKKPAQKRSTPFGASVFETAIDSRVSLLQVDAAAADSVVDQLASDPNVEYAEPNYTFRAFAAEALPNDPAVSVQWGLIAINAFDAWELGDPATASPVLVAVVDTGVDVDHEDLKDRLSPTGYNSITDTEDLAAVDDDNGHGTHVAGIIAASTNNGLGISGVAGEYPVTILPVKALDYTGNGTLLDIAEGVRWAADNGADVINMSLGAYLPDLPRTLAEAVEYAQRKGAIVVAAAGNDGYDLDQYKRSGSGVYPAMLPNVIQVAATNSDGQRAEWSNVSLQSVLAPGDAILSTYPGGYYSFGRGTSMAAPVVSGVLAVALAGVPGVSYSDLARGLSDYTYAKAKVLDMHEFIGSLLGQPVQSPTLAILSPEPYAYVRGTVNLRISIAGKEPRYDIVCTLHENSTGNRLGEPLRLTDDENTDPTYLSAGWDMSPYADGTYAIRCAASGYPGSEASVTFRLSHSEGFRVRVIRPDGQPAASAPVYLFYPTETEAWDGWLEPIFGETDLDGWFVLPSSVTYTGNEFLLVTFGSDPGYVYGEVVRAPGDLVLPGEDGAYPVTFELDQTLSAEFSQYPVPAVLAVTPIHPEAPDRIPAYGGNVPIMYLYPNQPETFHLTPGLYYLELLDPWHHAIISRRAVQVTGAGTVTLSADDKVFVQLEADPSYQDLKVWVCYPYSTATCIRRAEIKDPTGGFYLAPGDYWLEMEAHGAPLQSGEQWRTTFWRKITVTRADDPLLIKVGETPFAVDLLNGDLLQGEEGQSVPLDLLLRDQNGNAVVQFALGSQTQGYKPKDLVWGVTDATTTQWWGLGRAASLGRVQVKVPTAIPPGRHRLQLHLLLPMDTAQESFDLGDFLVGADSPHPYAVYLELRDALGNPLRDAEVSFLRLADGYYRGVDSASTSPLKSGPDGVVRLTATDNVSLPSGTYALLVQYAGPDGKEKAFLAPLGQVSQPLHRRIEAPNDFAQVTLELLPPDPNTTVSVRWIIDSTTPDGAHAIYRHYDQNAAKTETSLWLPAGTYRFEFIASGAGKSPYRLVHGPVSLGAGDTHAIKFDTDATHEVSLQPSGQLVLLEEGLYPELCDASSCAGSYRLSPGHYRAASIHPTGATDGTWEYVLAHEFTLSGGDLTLATDVKSLQAKGFKTRRSTYRPGDTVQVEGAIVDGRGNRLVGLLHRRSGAYSVDEGNLTAQNYWDVAPIITVIGPDGKEVFRAKEGTNTMNHGLSHDWSKLAAGQYGTYAGTAFTLPKDAKDGTYTVHMLLADGPLGKVEASTTFTVKRSTGGGSGGSGGGGSGGPIPSDAPPGPVKDLSAKPEDGALLITWTDPGDEDLKEIILTWGDGREARVPAGTGQYRITGLVNGAEYTITLVAEDRGGNQSTPVTVSGTPVAEKPQPTVPLPAGCLAFASRAYSLQAAQKATFAWDPDAVQGADPRHLVLYRLQDGQWTYVGGTVEAESRQLHARPDQAGEYFVLHCHPTFDDIQGHAARRDIEVLAARQVIHGVGNGLFEPGRSVTRAEMAKLLVAMLAADRERGIVLEGAANPTFADVPREHWAHTYVEAAHRLGIVRGWQGSFRPEDPVTREEMVAMLLRAAGLEERAASITEPAPYPDASSVSPWAVGYVGLAYQQGILPDDAADRLRPAEAAKRAEVAAALLRTMTWMGLIHEPLTLTGKVVSSEIEGKHLELEVAKDDGTSKRYTLSFFGPAAEEAAWAAAGKTVTVRGFTEDVATIFMRGTPLRVLDVILP